MITEELGGCYLHNLESCCMKATVSSGPSEEPYTTASCAMTQLTTAQIIDSALPCIPIINYVLSVNAESCLFPLLIFWLFSLSTQETIRGTWSLATAGSRSPGGRWSSATSAAYGCTCRARRSRSPTFRTSFTATSAGTCGGRGTKRTPRTERIAWCSFFFDAYSQKQPTISPGWQLYRHFVGFYFWQSTTVLIYPSFFFLFLLIFVWRTDRRRRWRRHWNIISWFLWLYCRSCADAVRSFCLIHSSFTSKLLKMLTNQFTLSILFLFKTTTRRAEEIYTLVIWFEGSWSGHLVSVFSGDHWSLEICLLASLWIRKICKRLKWLHFKFLFLRRRTF